MAQKATSFIQIMIICQAGLARLIMQWNALLNIYTLCFCINGISSHRGANILCLRRALEITWLNTFKSHLLFCPSIFKRLQNKGIRRTIGILRYWVFSCFKYRNEFDRKLNCIIFYSRNISNANLSVCVLEANPWTWFFFTHSFPSARVFFPFILV